MPLTLEGLEDKLKDTVGDPDIRIIEKSRQILCREDDEDLIKTLAARYAPHSKFEVVGF